MQKVVFTLFFLLVQLVSFGAKPIDEGMWLPLLIQRLNYQDMKKMGLQLSAEEIYSVNHSSLKDGIVMLGDAFCTAEVISSNGLLLSNHHCAYESIQGLSTLEKDLLKEGFWAKNAKEELSIPDLTATFLVRIEDVSQKIKASLSDDMSVAQREQAIKDAMERVEQQSEHGSQYTVTVKSFFENNEFYLFVYQTFRDIRLVGTPPESIGKFGGDTDNWMWPRQTGDFALLRIYADKNGKPADYSEDNLPYRPAYHLPISLDGVKRNDFTMVMGYPGETDRYLSSYGVKLLLEETNPKRVQIRSILLGIMKADMTESPEVRLKYSAKYASISNYWKFFLGQIKGLKRLKVYQKKQAEEVRFAEWVRADASRMDKYGRVLERLEKGFAQLRQTNVAYLHMLESVFGTEILPLAYDFSELYVALQNPDSEQEKIEKLIESSRENIKRYFKNYNAPTDERIMADVLALFYKDVDKSLHPDLFNSVQLDYDGDFKKFTAEVFDKSIFSSEEKLKIFLKHPTADVLGDDMALRTILSLMNNFFLKIQPLRHAAEIEIADAERLYVEGLQQMYPDKKFYPDANSTMRLSYGKVMDYFPTDAAFYSYYSTAAGILEKEDVENQEFVLPSKLKALLEKQDYGSYATDGELRVAFITDNDITGGSSGSPVLNAKGELVGVTFDNNWEAMSNSIAFEPRYQRCINVDIGYILFIIDKFADASHLIEEMTIKGKKAKKAKKFRQIMPIRY